MTSGGQLPPPQPPGPWSGGQFPPSPYLPPPPPAYPVAYSGGPPHAGPAPGIGYAGFWIRFVAALIDGIIIGVPLVIIFFVLEGSTLKTYADCLNNAVSTGTYAGACSSPFLGSIAPFELLGFGVEGLYFVGLWSQLGGTLGQRMLGLHVVDAATGKHIGVGRAIGRFIGYLISSAVFSIGLIWAAFDPRKQGWHDKMASTFVVRKV
jgi:uncharacterized RDD family membrane protein YckC